MKEQLLSNNMIHAAHAISYSYYNAGLRNSQTKMRDCMALKHSNFELLKLLQARISQANIKFKLFLYLVSYYYNLYAVKLLHILHRR